MAENFRDFMTFLLETTLRVHRGIANCVPLLSNRLESVLAGSSVIPSVSASDNSAGAADMAPSTSAGHSLKACPH